MRSSVLRINTPLCVYQKQFRGRRHLRVLRYYLLTMEQIFVFILTVAHVSLQQGAVGPSTLTTDRLWATMAAILALFGVVIGGLALTRSASRSSNGNGRKGAILALVTGLIATAVGGLVLATADGGPGTGNGVVGAGVALVLGLIATAIGWIALTRSRRIG